MAQFNLGMMYAKGEGLPQDFVNPFMMYAARAFPRIMLRRFLNLAGAKGNEKVNEDAGKARNRLAAKMTAVQVAEAQRRAREWKEKPRHDGQ